MTSKYVRIFDQQSQDTLHDARQALEATRAALDAIEAERRAGEAVDAACAAEDALLRLTAAGGDEDAVAQAKRRFEQADEAAEDAVAIANEMARKQGT